MEEVCLQRELEADQKLCYMRFSFRRSTYTQRPALNTQMENESYPDDFDRWNKGAPKSVQPTPPLPPRKLPAKRNNQEDELKSFLSRDVIREFLDLDEKYTPPRFSCKKTSEYVVSYDLSYVDGFPVIL